MKSTNAANTNNSTDKRGSDQDNSGAHAGVVDLSSILWRLQHLHIFQVYAGNIQTLCSKRQMMTLLLRSDGLTPFIMSMMCRSF